MGERATNPETEKAVVNPRAEIDTSPPFESVKEAVARFGGSGFWIPRHLFPLAHLHHGIEEYDLEKVEEQAVELEKDLNVKERETLGVLKELEATKRFVEGLKLKLVKEVPKCGASPLLNPSESLSLCPAPSPGLILMELNQAKFNLNKSSNNLAAIRSSVESLNNKMRKEKISPEKPPDHRQMPNPAGAIGIPMEEKLKVKADPKNLQMNFEAEQFKHIAEAAKYEVMKAMSEIEQTKNSINMVEMRLVAARKMEEAARAVEAIAFAEMKARSISECSSHRQAPEGGVTLSFEEFSCLTSKVQKAEELLLKKRARNAMRRIHDSNGSEEAKAEVKRDQAEGADKTDSNSSSKQINASPGHNPMFKFKNSYPSYGNRDHPEAPDANESSPVVQEKTVPVLRSTISIGDILSRKLILQDDFVVGNQVQGHGERQQVSLSQMLHEHSGVILQQPKKGGKEGVVHKQFFSQRKKFGFMDISLPLTKQSRKKTQQPLNAMR